MLERYTKYVYKTPQERKWFIVDANGKTLGRMAVKIANVLRGKDKPSYTPNSDTGDYVIVINAAQVHLTGNKREKDKLWWHTGHPGGIKFTTPRQAIDKGVYAKYVRNAIEGMMQHNPLGRAQATKLFVYENEIHKHEAQKPQVLEV